MPLYASVLLVGCATHNELGITFWGGSGASADQAIIFRYRADDEHIVAAEKEYLRTHHSGARLLSRRTEMVAPTDGHSRSYDVLTFITPAGQTKTLYFDITEFVAGPKMR